MTFKHQARFPRILSLFSLHFFHRKKKGQKLGPNRACRFGESERCVDQRVDRGGIGIPIIDRPLQGSHQSTSKHDDDDDDDTRDDSGRGSSHDEGQSI